MFKRTVNLVFLSVIALSFASISSFATDEQQELMDQQGESDEEKSEVHNEDSDVIKAARNVVAHLAKKQASSSDIVLIVDTALPEWNQQIEKLKRTQLDASQVSTLIAISEALDNNILPCIFELDSFATAREESCFGALSANIRWAGGIVLLCVGSLCIVTLWPAGMGMGLESYATCLLNTTLTDTLSICVNATGYAVRKLMNGPVSYCPEGFISLSGQYEEVCLVDGVLYDPIYEYQISRAILGATLGTLGGVGAFCCCGAGIVARFGERIVAPLRIFSAEWWAERASKKAIASDNFSHLFPASILALELLLEREKTREQ